MGNLIKKKRLVEIVIIRNGLCKKKKNTRANMFRNLKRGSAFKKKS